MNHGVLCDAAAATSPTGTGSSRTGPLPPPTSAPARLPASSPPRGIAHTPLPAPRNNTPLTQCEPRRPAHNTTLHHAPQHPSPFASPSLFRSNLNTSPAPARLPRKHAQTRAVTPPAACSGWRLGSQRRRAVRSSAEQLGACMGRGRGWRRVQYPVLHSVEEICAV